MPFALLVLSGDTHGPVLIGQLGAALAFLLVGAGVHTAQTAGLALATDLAPAHARPRVVALLYVMLLLGMVASSLVFSLLLAQFSALRLIQVVQGAALVAMLLNGVALWKQEPRKPRGAAETEAGATFREAWRGFARRPRTRRFLLALGLGTAAFSMQDILLEPYGGEILALPVAATTGLTAFLAIGALAAFALAAKRLGGGADPCRLAAAGAVIGLAAFAAVLFAPAIESATLFRTGTALIGFGGGLFSVGMLAAAMSLEASGLTGLALGAWGAVHATATGLAVGAGGVLRDAVGALASQGALGATLAGPATGYGFVYLVEILLLFVTLIAAGPLVQGARAVAPPSPSRFGLAEFPG
jgi:BCD family chlorophyll transporter-like MFS transporter